MFNNYTDVIMQTILLLTHDDSLVNELLTALPRGHRLVSGGEMAASASSGPSYLHENTTPQFHTWKTLSY